MQSFYAIVHKDADSAFGVHFPDLPGCFSAADSIDDVIPNAVEALGLWFEGADQRPQPSAIDHIRTLAAADLAEGAFLVLVPWIGRAGRPARVNISLDQAMLEAVDQAAARRRLSRSAFLAEAARNEIEGRH